MSDQGFYLGEHGLYDKRFMYEESFRTPMLIRYPPVVKANTTIDAYALNLDIAPTFLDLAGIAIPSDMQGLSMKKLLQGGKDAQWRKEIYYHYYERSFGLTPHYGIKTDQYKLLHFYGAVNSWELYDLVRDKKEMNNLAGNAKYSHIMQQLKTRLRYWQQYYKDPVKE
jgi:arylsulfatase A-like enzyme